VSVTVGKAISHSQQVEEQVASSTWVSRVVVDSDRSIEVAEVLLTKVDVEYKVSVLRSSRTALWVGQDKSQLCSCAVWGCLFP
jgi:acetolactate synthase regulatory subunit